MTALLNQARRFALVACILLGYSAVSLASGGGDDKSTDATTTTKSEPALTPNPTTGPLTIEGVLGNEITVFVVNEWGANVKELHLADGQFDISDLPKGDYQITVFDNETMFSSFVTLK